MTTDSLFKRQVSAPVQLSKGLFMRQISAPVHRLSICEENALTEPEWEPDDEDDLNGDAFQSIAPPVRQISVMSDVSAKAPERQVTAMSNMSGQDWEPIGASTIRRQSTDEQWPTWHGKDPLTERVQPNSDSHTVDEISDPYTAPWMPMMQPSDGMDMLAMPAMLPQLYTFVLPPTMQMDHGEQPPFRRKRESLIDLAKQQQEEKAANAGNAGSAAKSSDIKFCPWCGGNFLPDFKFCVFCGNEFDARKRNS